MNLTGPPHSRGTPNRCPWAGAHGYWNLFLKSIFIFRHGKSDWKADYSADHERPVAARGRRAARLMGRLLRYTSQIPDLVITSSAVRARTTADLAVEAGEWPVTLHVEPSLYGADTSTVLALIRAQPESLESVMLVGHEPTCSACAGLLSGGSDVRFPTAAMARIDFTIDSWPQIRPGSGQLIWLLPPKVVKRFSGLA